MTGESMTTDELDRLEALAETAGRIARPPWAVGDIEPTALLNALGHVFLRVSYNGSPDPDITAFIAACDPDTIRRLVAAAREPLDAAWREAEALAGSGLTLEYVVYPVVVEVGEPRIDPYRVKSGDHYAWGPTPAAALRALAEALRKPVTA